MTNIINMPKRTLDGGFTKKQLTKIILDKNKVIGDLEEEAYKGGKSYTNLKGGFNKKQLTKIILDKNKVIGDLEEEAYKGGRSRRTKLLGDGLPANVLKQFIDYSYLGNTSIAPEGYDIDSPLSDSRVKVYVKKGSNDKNVVVTHRGSVGLDDWWDNAKYMTMGKVKGTKTYNLHRERHKKAIDKYGAQNIIAIGHSRAGLYLQELQKEFPIKENITYNKATGFTDIGRQNTGNQTDVRVGNDVVSLLSGTQKNPNTVVKIDNTKNPFDFNKAHQTGELDRLGTQFIGKEEIEGSGQNISMLIGKAVRKNKAETLALEGQGITPRILDPYELAKMLALEQKRLKKIDDGEIVYKSDYMSRDKIVAKIARLKKRIENIKEQNVDDFIPKGKKWLKIHLIEHTVKNSKDSAILPKIIKRIKELLKMVDSDDSISKAEKKDVKKELRINLAIAKERHKQGLLSDRERINIEEREESPRAEATKDRPPSARRQRVSLPVPAPPLPAPKQARQEQAKDEKYLKKLAYNREYKKKQEYKDQRKKYDIKYAETDKFIREMGADKDKYYMGKKLFDKLEKQQARIKDPAKKADLLDQMSRLSKQFGYMSEILDSGKTVQNEIIARTEKPIPKYVAPVDEEDEEKEPETAYAEEFHI